MSTKKAISALSALLTIGLVGCMTLPASALSELPCDFRCTAEVNVSDSQDYSLAISRSHVEVSVWARAIQDGRVDYDGAEPGGLALAEIWGSPVYLNDSADAGRMG
ncbi:hypothetical protein [Bifidobacterium vespertilionis]|uniref:Uncharacterized protein n=1 Tax=Bifidobacterium vespertilionis TaxID=2562524 RepID=A0A5J5DYZ4_9BIFI|nr:hypothetical protein [Bifidobacterium vespertilionis]KAA8821952.1 hypothetical protein EMO90_01710 [Bifidobacterium vespertilionis]KAA8823257.1 hypothetical protein EM848_06080 [Bifidobacterium vespertilionis]